MIFYLNDEPGKGSKKYYLCGGEMVPPCGIDAAVNAAKEESNNLEKWSRLAG
jgi:hypothetical protein